jgi:hypothetical protein
MISIRYPSVLETVRRLPYGLCPAWLQQEGRFSLVIKAPKEVILTAQLRKEIRIYRVPNAEKADHAHGLMTCFFDDHDEPLFIASPLFAGDGMLDDVRSLLSQGAFDIHMFDGNDRELLASRASIGDVERLRSVFLRTLFSPYRAAEIPAVLKAMTKWFGQRSPADDAESFSVRLTKNLMPADMAIIDVSGGVHDFRDIGQKLVLDSLERPDPGPLQERDIAALLRSIFGHEAVLLNPLRADTGNELADVVVATADLLLLIQAKDSPNTEAVLNRPLARKRAMIRSHIDKGARQLQGALKFVRSNGAMVLRGNDTVQFEAGPRALWGALIVRELFEDEYRACSEPVLEVQEQTQTPCILLDYAGFLAMTKNLSTPTNLIFGLERMHRVAVEHGEYPKPRFLPA